MSYLGTLSILVLNSNMYEKILPYQDIYHTDTGKLRHPNTKASKMQKVSACL